MFKPNSVVAVYSNHTEADQAVKELQSGCVDLHENIDRWQGLPHRRACQRVLQHRRSHDVLGQTWRVLGRFLGALIRICFPDPGLGPILAAGPAVAWIVAGLEGAVEVGALGALGAGLYSIGIPKTV